MTAIEELQPIILILGFKPLEIGFDIVGAATQENSLNARKNDNLKSVSLSGPILLAAKG